MKNFFNISVNWTGSFPALCCGKWIIKINNVILSVSDEPFDTKKEYTHICQSYNKETGTYRDHKEKEINGYDKEEWIENVIKYDYNGLYSAICLNLSTDKEILYFLLSELYDKINIVDWEYGSCGGCL